MTPRFPVGAGGITHPRDVADLSDVLLSLGGLGRSGRLECTGVPNSRLNAAIAGFQKLNNLTPDGPVNPEWLPAATPRAGDGRAPMRCGCDVLTWPAMDGGRRGPAKAGKARARAAAAASPMMAQYLALKRENAECLLFYRMGDFYELFFEDAVAASAALDITLTRRGKHEGADIPMCGVPVHAADSYLARLVRKGFKVAIGEQVEDAALARKRGNKALVRREVTRIVTPGTITEESLLDARSHNYLAALGRAGGELALAWLDVSTGDLSAARTEPGALDAELARLEAGEILVSEAVLAEPEMFEVLDARKAALSPLPPLRFDSAAGEKRLQALYGVASLEGFGAFGRAELAALGAIVDYVELTQKGRLPSLKPPRRVEAAETLSIDAATRRNLELSQSLSGERAGSLLANLDRTLTGAGARLLAARLTSPLATAPEINRRLDAVEHFADEADRREAVRALLKECPDIERALARLTLGRGGPRDLAAIREALGRTAALRQALAAQGLAAPPEAVAAMVQGLGFHAPLVDRLAGALGPELPPQARDGGFIAQGYRPELDHERTLRDESRRLIAALGRRYAEATGVRTLKVRHNNVLGYFVEVASAHAETLGGEAHAETFVHRQSLASAVRYTTVELGELESRIGRAAERALALELELFEDLVGEVAAGAAEVGRAAEAIAELDVATGLAEHAVIGRWVRPRVDDSLAFEIAGGRHPVVEAALEGRRDHAFVGNDCDLGEGRRLWLVSGPNMAGKSTFLRQNALIAVLAQMGAFVPARAAHIGVVDRLFSRVGAADDLARGRSTFMVEMVETAAILNLAGPRALVILDEIGRGTATYDGLSIAWAAVEHLHEVNRCRALFATHYHELTALGPKLEALSCHALKVKEWKGEVVFLYEVAPGAADRSYGIQVAKLAGVPAPVIARAEAVLAGLQRSEAARSLNGLADALPLFASALHAPPAATEGAALRAALEAAHPDALSPREALELIYRLKALAAKDEGDGS